MGVPVDRDIISFVRMYGWMEWRRQTERRCIAFVRVLRKLQINKRVLRGDDFGPLIFGSYLWEAGPHAHEAGSRVRSLEGGVASGAPPAKSNVGTVAAAAAQVTHAHLRW